MLTHGNITATVQMYASWTEGAALKLEDGKERVLMVLPMFHIYGLSAVLLRMLTIGAEFVLHPRFELKAVIEDLHKKKVSIFPGVPTRSEEHTSELQSLMRISYAVFCLKQKKHTKNKQ